MKNLDVIILKENARELLKEVEKDCHLKQISPDGYFEMIKGNFAYCGCNCKICKDYKCPECQETIKILKEIS